jgi:hypothetical protein
MSFELFHASEFHHRWSDVLEAFLGQVSACNVLDVRGQIDTRVLFCVSIGGCSNVSILTYKYKM